MFNRFIRKLKISWPPALTIPAWPKTIHSDTCSMSKKQTNETEASLFSTGPVLAESPPNRVSEYVPPSEKVHKSFTVVCACIMREGGQQVLLSMRRAPGVPGLDNKWELPGGKVEFGETPEQTIVREIREELGIGIAP